MNSHVIKAIFTRNFVSYFSNPTGYVFICVFVLLSSFAAFWPNDFFNANLANLDQLNKALPYILLVFIPAITMSIWADERRQGTDELLLTIPAGDFDVVLGKYLAAVGIYTVALTFSAFCNFLVLWVLSDFDLDIGLFLGTYFGYWWVGLAMVAIGMAASFLTGNLTVGFVLGAIFNAPLTFAAAADSLALPEWMLKYWPGLTHGIRRLSLSEQFHDFARGVISFAGIVYFLSLAAVMLYLSMVLIGRRHWSGGRDGQSMGLHYLARFVCLLVTLVALNVYLSHHDRWRVDVTSERLSSLSPQTATLLKNLDSKSPVLIEAFISASVPENYVPTRLNLLGVLRELSALGGNKLKVTIHDHMEPFSDEATRAEMQFDIKPQSVASRSHGVRSSEEIFLGVAITCGLEKVVIPFFDRGIPVEYELVRSIATVSEQKRKKLGIVNTDAKLFGDMDMMSMSQTRNELIVDELKKQYDVVQVDASHPITENYDVLLAVQPSSLGPQQMDNFVAAVQAGQPTAIFEDPFPVFAQDVPGTNAPKQPPGGMNPFMMRQPPQPKGDISKLWRLLGVDFMSADVIWQDYNPYPKGSSFITREWVFIDPSAGNDHAFSAKSSITSGLRQVLVLYAGSIRALNNSPLTYLPLMSTGDASGYVPADKIVQRTMAQARFNPDLPRFEKPTGEKYHVAATLRGSLKPQDQSPAHAANQPMSDKEPADDDDAKADDTKADTGKAEDQAAGDKDAKAGDAKDAKGADNKDATGGKPAKDAAKPAEPAKPKDINVVLVADIDCLYSAFFVVRNRGADEDDEIDWKMENVTFVLNALDVLAGDDRFVEIRKRQPNHKTLRLVSDTTEKARSRADAARLQFMQEFDNTKKEEQDKLDKMINDLRKGGNLDPTEVMRRIEEARGRMETLAAKYKQQLDRQLKVIEREKSAEIRSVEDRYKLLAVVLPPIPPLLLAFFVFFNRRAQEREGVSKARLR